MKLPLEAGRREPPLHLPVQGGKGSVTLFSPLEVCQHQARPLTLPITRGPGLSKRILLKALLTLQGVEGSRGPSLQCSLTSPKPPLPSTRYCRKVFLVTGCLEKYQESDICLLKLRFKTRKKQCWQGTSPGHVISSSEAVLETHTLALVPRKLGAEPPCLAKKSRKKVEE